MPTNDTVMREIPSGALRLKIGEFSIGDNGEGSKSAPLEIKARSGDAIEHWFFGRVIHDLAGMKLSKPRIAVDYNHDAGQIIGYLNRFDSSSGDLIASGALVPYKGDDRATEIIFKAKQGIPYEASIFFGGDGVVLEDIADGETVEVNGRSFAGPGVVVREWPLRGVAICPYGADSNTETRLAIGGETAKVNFKKKGVEMASEAEGVKPVEATAAEIAAAEAKKKAEEEARVAELASVEAEKLKAAELAANPGKKFMAAFGESRGAIFFAKGVAFEEAERTFNAEIRTERDALAKERDELKTRLAAIAGTGADAAAVSATAAEAAAGKPDETFLELATKFATENKVTKTVAMREVAKINPEAWKRHRSGKK